jgi:hypothetical protein
LRQLDVEHVDLVVAGGDGTRRVEEIAAIEDASVASQIPSEPNSSQTLRSRAKSENACKTGWRLSANAAGWSSPSFSATPEKYSGKQTIRAPWSMAARVKRPAIAMFRSTSATAEFCTQASLKGVGSDMTAS